MDTEKLIQIRNAILYRNDDEKKNAYRQCIEYVIEHDEFCNSFSVDEFEHLLNNPDEQTEDNRAEWTFHDYLSLDEGSKLFELACQKYGYKLWNGNAWHNKEENNLQDIMKIVNRGAEYWRKLILIAQQNSIAVSYQELSAIKSLIDMAETGNIPSTPSGKIPSRVAKAIETSLKLEEKLKTEGLLS